MAKIGTKKKQSRKLSKNKQYERFQQTAHEFEVDNEQSAEAFERAFTKIIPAKRKTQS